MSYWYMDKGYLRARTGQELWYNGFKPDAIGDLVYNQAWLAWAKKNYKLLGPLIQLLNQGKRWPNTFNDPEHIAKNKLDKLIHPLKYRPQNDVTRDPYVMVIAVTFKISPERICDIRDLKIPWKINRPDLYYWRKYLLTGKIKYLKRYEFWAGLSLMFTGKSKKNFILTLHCVKAYIACSDKMKQKLSKYIDPWNMLQMGLIGEYNDFNQYKEDASYYIAKTNIQWNQSDWREPGFWNDERFWNDEDEFLAGNVLPMNDKIKLDKDMLQCII